MASLPQTYKAAVLEKHGEPLVFRDIPLKAPGEGEVLVKVLACGVCGSDGHIQQVGMGPIQQPLPLVMGHELVGDVVAAGPGTERFHFQKGDRVGGQWHGGHDGTCRSCQTGVFQMCDKRAINGVTRDGGFAQYAILRAEATTRLPADADPVATAPLLCAGVTVFNGLRQLHIEQGALVAVQGLGALGHLAVQYARAMGYDVAVLSSSDSKRQDALETLGAQAYINTSTEDPATALQNLDLGEGKTGGAAAILCTAPNPKIVPALIGGLRTRGTLLMLSPLPEVTISCTALVMNGTRIAGWPSGHQLDGQEAVAFAKRHGVKAFVETFKFSDVGKALERLQSGKARFKVVLDMRE